MAAKFDLTADPWDAQKDYLIIIQELFKNFVVARAVMENAVRDPAHKFERILYLMRLFCQNHTELSSLTSKPVGSLTNTQTIHYIMGGQAMGDWSSGREIKTRLS